ncbi:BZ3500_MvSof-1268-A1-R1_Chr9g10764 [Microbotryum saponariae]|uniref:Anaphase-promoting complex subunit 5 n=1 Tax=Microbotryum saponariae TaxID=289078 RepID=A0A2X0L578_9BASI|nr:BZ3501_MvSof-1269-A2-R1_Chr9g10512 [Microbotryum saponariae]SDA00649.1 BZ3500_MvSof-1268-A1-R1_Chr9g10764 [Microbotryum saponariae]
MPPTTPPLHPSQIPTLILITLLPTTVLSTSPIQDSILELCLSCLYEVDPPKGVNEWVRRIDEDDDDGIEGDQCKVLRTELKTVILESVSFELLGRMGSGSWFDASRRARMAKGRSDERMTHMIVAFGFERLWLWRGMDWICFILGYKVERELLPNRIALARNVADSAPSSSPLASFTELKRLYPSTEEDEASLTNTVLHRLSPLALFIRRFRLTFSQLSFDQAVKWWEGVNRWCGISLPTTMRGKNGVRGRESTTRELVAQSYRDARACADYQGMKDALAYYDLDDGTGGLMKGRPQTALLNLAFLEYTHQGYIAAREALNEAIQVARNVGDSQCLATAASLKARLDFTSPSTRHLSTTPTTSQPTPTDLLHTLMDLCLNSTTPLPSLFTLLYASRTAYQIPPPPQLSLSGTKPPQTGGPQPSPKTSPLSELLGTCEEVQAGEEGDLWEAQIGVVGAELWRQIGSTNLSRVGEELAFEALERHAISSRIDPTTEWDLRIAILCRQSQRLARSNRTAEALTVLLAAVDTRSKRSSMGLVELVEWENLIWELIHLEAERLEDHSTLELVTQIQPRSFKSPLRTKPEEENYTESTPTTTKELPLPLLHEALITSSNLLDSSSPYLALNPTLNALYSSRKQSRYKISLVALLRLVELRIRISPSREEAERGLRDMEEEWEGFLRCGVHELDGDGDGDGDVLGLGWETRGRLEVLKGLRKGREQGKGDGGKLERDQSEFIGSRRSGTSLWLTGDSFVSHGSVEEESLFRAIRALEQALQIYENLDQPSCIKRVLVLLVHVYDNLSQHVDPKYNQQKEEYATRVIEMDRQRREGRLGTRSLEGLVDVLELVRGAVVGKVISKGG